MWFSAEALRTQLCCTHWYMNYYVVKKDSEISPPRRGGHRVKVFIKKYSELCVLCVSVVNLLFTVNAEEPEILGRYYGDQSS